jgi:hypothetical protein
MLVAEICVFMQVTAEYSGFPISGVEIGTGM